MDDARPGIAVLSTAWGTRHGGINSFSTDFCLALARVLPSHRIACVVPDAHDDDIRYAEGAGVVLVPLQIDPDTTMSAELTPRVLQALRERGVGTWPWCIGHDVITGDLAISCSRGLAEGRSAVFMHMSYNDYAYAKHSPEEAISVAEKTRRQREVLKLADHAFAVGPLLYERLREIRGYDKDRATALVPGLLEKTPPLESKRLHAITFGRFEPSDALIKQAPLAVAAFAQAVCSGFESSRREVQEALLTVIGAPPDAARGLRALAERQAGRVVNLQVLEYVEDRLKLKELLCHSNLCLMLSWHEGFGLAGWEAIGAGIPLIVSRNSGVYKLLDSIGGAALGCIRHLDVHGRGDGLPNEDDIQTTRKLILEVASDIPKAQADADSLRNLLRFQYKYTWDATAVTAARAMGLAPIATVLCKSSQVDDVLLVEPADVIEGLDVAAAQRVLALAETFYHGGQYEDALASLEQLKSEASRDKMPTSIAIDASLTECDILLRLNQYPQASALVASATREAADRQDWRRYIRARSIENAVLRDLGKYDDAVSLAQDLLHLSERLCPEARESSHRKLGRSLALAGRWDEAIKQGERALALARERRDREGEAKALLVIGEGYRHGLNQGEAVRAYTLGRDLSGRAGNVDCYFWNVLGLGDSLFLLGQPGEAGRLLNAITVYMAGSAQHYPLEALHLKLSLLCVRHVAGEALDGEFDGLLELYKKLGVLWPIAYVDQICTGDYSHPKRF